MIYFRSPLTKMAAEKARDCLVMGLYEKLFGQIMLLINDRSTSFSSFASSSSSTCTIGILDIPGFGKYKIYGFIMFYCSSKN